MPGPVPGALGCAEFRALDRNRREVIRLGALTGVGLLLPDLLRVRNQARAGLERDGRGSANPGHRPLGHHDLSARRACAAGDLGPQTRRAIPRTRPVRRDLHERARGRSASCFPNRRG